MRREGAKANAHALGWPEPQFPGNIWSADSHDHREAKLKSWAPPLGRPAVRSRAPVPVEVPLISRPFGFFQKSRT